MDSDDEPGPGREPVPEGRLSLAEVVGLLVLLWLIAMVVLLLFVGPALKHHFVDASGSGHGASSTGEVHPALNANAFTENAASARDAPRGVFVY